MKTRRLRPPGPSRRDLLRAGVAAGGLLVASGLPGVAGTALAAGRRRRRPRRLVPRVNGFVNIQPIRVLDRESFERLEIFPELVDLQMRALYELGFEGVRVTLSYDPRRFELLAAVPYVRAARALGLEVLGIVGQFGFDYDLARALADPARREAVLRLYLDLYHRPVSPVRGLERAGGLAFQILNEPTNFLGLRPAQYVEHFLAPAAADLRRLAPDLPLVCAAPVGTAVGVLRARELLESGAERHCDRLALHVYDAKILPDLAALTDLPVWITETGADGTARHHAWWTEVLPLIGAGLPNAERIYWFELADLIPGRFRLIEVREAETGFEAVVESPGLYDLLLANVAGALGGRTAVPYKRLVPDITRYFPTDEDVDRVLSFPGS